MKLLMCEECGDVIAPYRERDRPRYCICGRHAVWWKDPTKGVLRVCDTHSPREDKWPIVARAWVIGLTNSFLGWPHPSMSAQDIEMIIDSHEDYYLFKKQRSCVIRIRPGDTGDTRWSELPEQWSDAARPV